MPQGQRTNRGAFICPTISTSPPSGRRAMTARHHVIHRTCSKWCSVRGSQSAAVLPTPPCGKGWIIQTLGTCTGRPNTHPKGDGCIGNMCLPTRLQLMTPVYSAAFETNAFGFLYIQQHLIICNLVLRKLRNLAKHADERMNMHTSPHFLNCEV